MSYVDLRDYLAALEEREKLIRVKREINKDTELMPLVRWQFRGLPEQMRKGFLFEKVTDAKGRRYRIPVAVATHAGSRGIYALAMGCKPDEIHEKWVQARVHPFEPEIIDQGPVHEEVHMGADLEKEGAGLEEFPIPVSTPGFDPAPFITAGCWVTRDLETSIRNLGTYRAHLKGRACTGIQANQHVGVHVAKAKALGQPLPAALIIGGPPAVALVSTAKIPYGTDEFAVAGGIIGAPLEMVKCKTIDLEVPAYAEIVLEGELTTDCFEPEAPFGEFTGYMGYRNLSPIFNIKCITHRKDPIYHAFISQFPPSESSKIRSLGKEGNLYKFLKHDCNIPGILEVALHEESGGNPWCVIRMRKTNYSQPWQALNCAIGYQMQINKVIIVVDEDIDARDPDSVIWAISFRAQPDKDMRITHGTIPSLDPSGGPPELRKNENYFIDSRGCSCLLIDATLKWGYQPVALPKREFMERARDIWQQLGLPELTPKIPWYGYELGMWTDENREEANLAVKGEYMTVGKKLAGRRQDFWERF